MKKSGSVVCPRWAAARWRWRPYRPRRAPRPGRCPRRRRWRRHRRRRPRRPRWHRGWRTAGDEVAAGIEDVGAEPAAIDADFGELAGSEVVGTVAEAQRSGSQSAGDVERAAGPIHRFAVSEGEGGAGAEVDDGGAGDIQGSRSVRAGVRVERGGADGDV